MCRLKYANNPLKFRHQQYRHLDPVILELTQSRHNKRDDYLGQSVKIREICNKLNQIIKYDLTRNQRFQRQGRAAGTLPLFLPSTRPMSHFVLLRLIYCSVRGSEKGFLAQFALHYKLSHFFFVSPLPLLCCPFISLTPDKSWLN